MERKDEYVYDFATDAWLVRDRFNGRIDRSVANPATSGSEPLPGFWTKPAPSPQKPRIETVLLTWAALACTVASLVLIKPKLVVFAALCGGAAFLIHALRRAEASHSHADRMLLENPDDLDVLLVGIAILRNGVDVGRDRGVVWFEDGKLLYNGHRTSFAIGGEDILLPHEWPRGAYDAYGQIREQYDVPERMVLLRTPGDRTSVEFTPVLAQNNSTPQEMRFLKRLYEFRRRPPQSRGPRQWPPFDPSP